MECKKEYILNEINIFDDIWFIDCFNHAFIPIVNYMNSDINYLISNNLFFYNTEYDQYGNILVNSACLFGRNEVDTLQYLNLKLCEYKKVKNLINAIRCSITKNRPVILAIDCFYSSIRTDTYKKVHLPHSLLIYGYNDKIRQFSVFEHENNESIKFHRMSISYDDLLCSYEGYLNFGTNGITYFEYHKASNITKNKITPVTLYEYKLQKNIEQIINSISKLDYISLFISHLMTKKDMNNDKYLLFKYMNNIINNKLLEIYTIDKLYPHLANDLNELKEALKYHKFIRNVFGRYYLAGQIKEDSALRCIEYITKIKDLEKRHYSSFLESRIKNI